MNDLNRITVRKKDIVMRRCDACGTKTAHVGTTDGTRTVPSMAGTSKQPFSTCIQCFVDSNDVNEYSRWIDPVTGQRLSKARGYESK